MSSPKGLSVLVVDDHEVTRNLLKEVLEKEGYSIQLAGSGEEAVRLLRKQFYPIVISDIRMIGPATSCGQNDLKSRKSTMFLKWKSRRAISGSTLIVREGRAAST